MPEPHTEPRRVVVVDDHELFLGGLVAMLRQRGVVVVGTAGSGEAALAVVARERPDAVLMDLGLPDMSGVEATRRMRSEHPGLCVVVLTALADEASLIEAVRAGAAGYLLKDASIDEILAGVEAALRGDSLVAPQVTGKLLRSIRDRPNGSSAVRPPLSEREQQVLELMVEGRDNVAIARELYISESTVKHHVSAILTKLGVENRVQAVVRAIRGRIA
jgi:DNA-binding NarL/FixJ family response regulator